jgi:hypothetical protein
VFIKHGNSIIKACDIVGGRGFELGKEEVAVFPVIKHFVQGFLNMELFVGSLTYFFANIYVLEHSCVND